MSTDKKTEELKEKEIAESLHPERHKGPQKSEHTNQYGEKDDNIKTP